MDLHKAWRNLAPQPTVRSMAQQTSTPSAEEILQNRKMETGKISDELSLQNSFLVLYISLNPTYTQLNSMVNILTSKTGKLKIN